jgi:hypothetical protein
VFGNDEEYSEMNEGRHGAGGEDKGRDREGGNVPWERLSPRTITARREI